MSGTPAWVAGRVRHGNEHVRKLLAILDVALMRADSTWILSVIRSGIYLDLTGILETGYIKLSRLAGELLIPLRDGHLHD